MLNGEESGRKPVVSGIPQGSVLGPVLFIMYVNDMPDKIRSLIKFFANDTKLDLSAKSSSDQNTIQSDLFKLHVCGWSKE